MDHRLPLLLAAAALLAGCESESKMLDSQQAMATDAALRRGRFEMNCASPTTTILSRQMVEQPVGFRRGGFEDAEYTIGLEGCGQRRSYVVVCPPTGDTCFAGGVSR
jgi:hypothetical protein